MKKSIWFLIAILIFSLHYSCTKKDNTAENTVSTTNGFKVNNIFYNTEMAGINVINDTFQLIFYSKSVSFDTTKQQWKGTGHAVAYNELLSSNIVNDIPIGNFQFSLNTQLGYFTEAITRTNYNFTQNSGIERDCILGNISISKIGSTYKIVYNLTNSDSTIVSGEFNGTPQNITSWFHKK